MFKITAKASVSAGIILHNLIDPTKNALLTRLMRRVHFTAAELPRPLAPSALHDRYENGVITVAGVHPNVGLEQEQEQTARVRLQRGFKLHRLSEGPDTMVSLTQAEAVRYYRQMKAIRQIEAAANRLYKERMVRGFCHLYTGQEACAVGMRAVMRPEDSIISAYRVHGWAYLMGLSAQGVLAELTGRRSGCSCGKGGSMHMYAPNFYGGNGIVGAQVSLGAGVALASKYRQNGGVCLALYGDGAANQGQVFESFNMAALWQLPIVFVCENNNYGMGTSAERAACNTRYYTRGDVLPGIWVDGMDVLAVRSATEYAIEFAQNRGPLLLELCTYRYGGHSLSDPGTSYRSREEVKEVRRKSDAINRFRELCLDYGLQSQEQLEEIDAEVQTEVQNAVKVARSDEELAPQYLWADVYAQNIEPRLRSVYGYDLMHARSKPT
ncbi:pyruvate dehydrogenase E1 component subunit alpha, mitochondrial-like [Scaptodrosophila lebanonensis]|uniref:Pyruvate dehydrogenase E1 component subunit alpha n=1 Tax=Drosophila lebanonensis TaxID=7225 RepID=A0A6J2UAE1_DROLE|nr:pyruvate dehydrogenase E1 component subunit alpha, mitochondrial-like [Scaptodrosophila lebanonensis]